MTPTEKDKELDLFSEEALKIAEALRNKYPNTWELLYNNHVMPEVIAFITADRERVALEAQKPLIGLLERQARHFDSHGANARARNLRAEVARLTQGAGLDRGATELKAQQEKL